jgi:aminoglycoside phosphotransferase (APT) family kinase protein
MAAPSNQEFPFRAALERWLDTHHLGQGDLELTPIGGGTQNTILCLTRGEDRFVLRAPSPDARRDAQEAMAREGAILRAFADTDVPHPRLLGHEPDPGVLGVPFLITCFVEGFNLVEVVPPSFAADQAVQRRLGFDIVDALLVLARVNPSSVGLGGLGYPDGWLGRQTARWSSQLAEYRRTPGYGADDLPGTSQLETWLQASPPRQRQSGLIHGDFHLANLLATEHGHVAAFLDWELCTQGDPLLDFAQLLVTWPSGAVQAEPLTTAVSLPGLPTTDDLVAAYFRDSSFDPQDLRWFCVLAAYRLAVLVEGTYVRSLVGRAAPANGIRLHAMARGLVDAGRAYLAGGPI